MAYVGLDFSDMDVGEAEVFTFDFVRDLAKGETPVSTTWTCEVASGSDPSPASRLDGFAEVQGTKSLQKISGLIAGTRYLLLASVTTNRGNVVSLWSFVNCVAPKVPPLL